MGESLYFVKFVDGQVYAEYAVSKDEAERKAKYERRDKESVEVDVANVEKSIDYSSTIYSPIESISVYSPIESISLDSLDTSGLYSTGTSYSHTVTVPYDPSKYTITSSDTLETDKVISELTEKVKRLEAELLKVSDSKVEEDPNDSEDSLIGKLIHWVYDDGPLTDSGMGRAIEYTSEGHLKLDTGDILDLDDFDNLYIEVVHETKDTKVKKMKGSKKLVKTEI